MNRKRFLGLLALVGVGAKAQTASEEDRKLHDRQRGRLTDHDVKVDPEHKTYPLGWQKFGQAMNNQCPVCGTFAAPWRGKPREVDMMLGGAVPRIDNLVRCARCNAAFWQDAGPSR